MFNILGKTIEAFLNINIHPWENLGDCLFVGEGNLSFAKSVITHFSSHFNQMTATTYEDSKSIEAETMKNALFLKSKGAIVKHGLDATKLSNNINQMFDTIIFQFPNVGSREPKYGQNPNHIMIRKFLDESKLCLNKNGKVFITVVDNPYYKGAFKFENIKGYRKPDAFPFDPRHFIGYNHINTNDDDSALDKHHRFITYIFRPL